MKILELKLTNVTKHAETKLVFPARGIVCVTGDNGAGKSTIIEAPSVAVWGQSLRKKPVWRRTGKGSIVALVDVGRETLMIQRQRVKSKELLDFSSLHSQVVYDTKTKAQEQLSGIVGSHARWRRTHVFSSSDVTHFTQATDSERKKLLEDILGLERFDAAHATANRDRRQLEKEVALRESRAALAAERVRSTKARLEDMLEVARQIPASLPTHVPDLEKTERKLAKLAERIESLDDQINAATNDLQARTAKVERAEAQADHVGSIDQCDACGSSIGVAHQAKLKKHAASVRAALEPTVQELSATLEGLRKERTAAMAQRSALRDEKARLAAAIAAAKERAESRQRAEERVRTLRQDLEDAHDAHDEATAAVAGAKVELEVVQAAEKVLSLSGVRSYLLGQALAGVEEIANTWLARLVGTDEVKLRLSPYSEKASGGVKDAISLEIDGVGEGYGYAASSGGERRRIDIALLFALAEVAEAASGISTGTMFFDEVFDALDPDGVTAAIEVLEELAKDRCVVLITHNPNLHSRVTWTKRWHVSGGKVTEETA